MRRLRNSGEPEIITLQELAELLGTHYQTALKLVRAGEIPGFRLGSGWRFWREDVNRWIKRRHFGPRPVAKQERTRPLGK